MDKQAKYKKLVADVNSCVLCDGTTAKSRDKATLIYLEHAKTEHVNLWSYWQGNLSPEILIIGQDWGSLSQAVPITVFADSKSYRANIIKDKNPTDNNLCRLFKDAFSVDILQEQKLFFTNSIFCYKKGNLNENVITHWFDNCNIRFMKKLILILEPKCVITLGEKALRGLAKSGNIQLSDNRPATINNVSLTSIVQNPEQLWWVTPDDKTRVMLFPVFHPGANSNINRPYPEQIKDWSRIKPYVSF